MEKIKTTVEQLLTLCGITANTLPVASHIAMVVVAILLAAATGWFCRKIAVPLLHKLTLRTEPKWDEVVFNEKVLRSAASIVPAIIIWLLLPLTFYDFPTVREVLSRLTALYITVMTVRTIVAVIDSVRLLGGDSRTSRQQYLYTLCSVLKIVLIFVTAIVVVAIVFDKDPSTLFAGLGAASAILMLAFQDTIKGLVAGIRLTSNDMLHIGDWITVPSAGANGKVEEITLTMVKIRNFDNTIITVTPQTLVDGYFQNWVGMQEREGRKQSRKVYFDFRSIRTETLAECTAKKSTGDKDADTKAAGAKDAGDKDAGAKDTDASLPHTNITRYRRHIEEWLAKHPAVLADKPILVRQADATQAGCCVEFNFWLRAQDALTYEHNTSDIMEYIFAAANDFGLELVSTVIRQ